MALATVFTAFTFLPTLCLAVEHNLGPWVLGKQAGYKQWAAQEIFKPGDTLKFEFAAGVHNVWRLATQEEYDSCNLNSPVQVYNDANAVITLHDTGKNFFVCGVGDHCSGGMKVTINVADPSSEPVAHSPRLSPSLAPSSSPARRVTNHSIGPWVLGKQFVYKSWAARETFFPGDTLEFKYAAGAHNVWQLATQEEYDSCNVNSPIKVYNDANAVVALDEPGKYFFVCGVGNGKHCLGGMKVTINVADPSKPLIDIPAAIAPGYQSGTLHNIGHWVMGMQGNYKTWAIQETFVPGDSLKFEFAAGEHNVWQLATKEEYESCNVSNPVKIFNDANPIIPLEAAGKHFYVCGKGNGKHCLGGMKVTINVVDPASVGGPYPAPAPDSAAVSASVGVGILVVGVNLVLTFFMLF